MIYDVKCQKCGVVQEIVRTVSCRHQTPVCCNEPTKLMISAPYVVPDVNMVCDDITGVKTHITSRKQLEKICRENDVRPTEGFLWK